VKLIRDMKDHLLLMYLMERKRMNKWNMKLFRRLLNTKFLTPSSYTGKI
jgi:hypothetical protein